MQTPTTAIPRCRMDAAQILANPAAYADRPSLIQLAQLVRASETGQALIQLRRGRAPCRRPDGVLTPHLTVIEGGLA